MGDPFQVLKVSEGTCTSDICYHDGFAFGALAVCYFVCLETMVPQRAYVVVTFIRVADLVTFDGTKYLEPSTWDGALGRHTWF